MGVKSTTCEQQVIADSATSSVAEPTETPVAETKPQKPAKRKEVKTSKFKLPIEFDSLGDGTIGIACIDKNECNTMMVSVGEWIAMLNGLAAHQAQRRRQSAATEKELRETQEIHQLVLSLNEKGGESK